MHQDYHHDWISSKGTKLLCQVIQAIMNPCLITSTCACNTQRLVNGAIRKPHVTHTTESYHTCVVNNACYTYQWYTSKNRVTVHDDHSSITEPGCAFHIRHVTYKWVMSRAPQDSRNRSLFFSFCSIFITFLAGGLGTRYRTDPNESSCVPSPEYAGTCRLMCVCVCVSERESVCLYVCACACVPKYFVNNTCTTS